MLGYEDHGIFTAILYLDYGGLAQGAGMYSLDEYDKRSERRIGTAGGMDFIIGVLSACGVENWEKVKGRTVIAVLDTEDSWSGNVIGIKSLPTEKGTEFMFADAFPQEVTT